MSHPCPDVVDDIPEACADRQWFEDHIYYVLDRIVDVTNVHWLAGGQPVALPYIIRPWDLVPPHQAADLEEVQRFELFLTDLLATGRVPKYMYQEGQVPVRFPDPTNANEVTAWETCDGYWATLQEVRDCMDLNPDQILSESVCLEIEPANTYYKILKCLAEGKCYSSCECPECSSGITGCLCYTEIYYDPDDETWDPVDIGSLVWECKEKFGPVFAPEPVNAWISDGPNEQGLCRWHRWSTECEEV